MLANGKLQRDVDFAKDLIFFFENENGTTIMDNGHHYRTLITDFFIPIHHAIDVNGA